MKRALLAAIVAASSIAHADAPQRPPHRALPDYDGREAPSPSALDIAAWIPRIVLFPARIVVDYGVRKPIGFVVSRAENSKGFRKFMRRFFQEVEESNVLIFPVALVDFGFNNSVGARVIFRRGVLVPKSDVTLRLGFGGPDMWRADVTTKSRLGAARARLNVGANQRPDYTFFGIGSYSQPDSQSRYTARRAGATASVGGAITGVGELAMHVGLVDVDFQSSRFNGDPSIEDSVMSGRIGAIPPGYGDGFRAARVGGRLTLDTRYEEGRRATSGARLDINVERVADVEHGGEWTRFDLLVGAGLLLDPVAERKLDVRLGVQHVRPDEDGDVPFSELPSLAGNEWLRGLPGGRIHDVSAAAFIMDYHWPVAAWLDAHAHLGAGNVYASGLSGFSLASLRGSFGGALTIAGLSERQIGVFYAWGTEPLGQGIDVSSSRFILEYSGDY